MGWWKQKAPCGMNLRYQDIFHISDYYIHIYIYISYVNSMILYITIYYNILQYITITIYKVLVQSLALASMVSMAVASAPTTGSLRGQARHWMVVPEIQIWMEWIQEWIFICYPLVNVYIAMENHHVLMGKSTINGHFQIAMLNYQRVVFEIRNGTTKKWWK